MTSILIVDDDAKLTEMLTEYLAAEGFDLSAASTGSQGLREALSGGHDLIVLDVMLPGISGFDLLRQLREGGSKKPVLMLTARGDDVDRIVGLEMGADDYLAKPFNPRELVARIRAILRRAGDTAEEPVAATTIGPLHADFRRREASIDGEPLKLTNAELIVLFTLMQARGEVVSREALTRAALGRQLLPDDRSLDTHVSNLRRKLAETPAADIQIRSIRGSGYVLMPPAES